MINLDSRWWRLLMAATVITIATAACQPSAIKVTQTPAAPAGTEAPRPVAPRVGSLAPDFTVKMLTGETVRLSELRGKPVLLNFWATWCPPCREEMPFLQAVYKDRSYQDVLIIAMDRDEDTATINEFMRQNGYTFPVALDPGLSVSDAYQVFAIPTTFLIGRDGVIRLKKIGAFLNKGEIESSLKMIMR